MFNEEEITYMKSIGLNFDFNKLSDDEYVEIEDTVGDQLVCFGLEDDYALNEEGIMCKTILSKLP